MKKLIDIYLDKVEINEARVTPIGVGARILPKEEAKYINILLLLDDIEDNSESINKPSSTWLNLNDYNTDNPKYIGLKASLSRYKPGTILLSNDISSGYIASPNAPKNSYSSVVAIEDKDTMLIQLVPLDSTGKYMAGWFDTAGKYHPDTKNFDKDRNYIGGVQEARVTPKYIPGALTPLQKYIYDYEVEASGEDFAEKERENIKKLNTLTDILTYYSSHRGWAEDSDLRDEMIKIMTVAKEEFGTPVSEQIAEAEKLMKRAGIKSEARVLPVKMPKYKYKIGETVREENGDEEAAKILDRRIDWDDVLKNPVDKEYLPMFMEHDEDTDNNPWYLVQWLEDNADKKPTWWIEEELQPYYTKDKNPDEYEEDIDEARVTPVAINSLKSSDLYKTLDKYYDYDLEYFAGMDMYSKADLRFVYKDEILISELIALNIYKELLDFYNKYKKVVVDGTDYTKDFLWAMDHYKRDPNNITDINTLKEARVTPVSIPSQKYGIADWVYSWTDDFLKYDDLVYELGEDTADAIWLLTSIIDINKQSTLNIIDVRKFRNSIYSDGWEGSVDDLIKNLLDYKVIVPITNEARVTPVNTAQRSISTNYINLVNDSITKAITDIIKNDAEYVGGGFNIIKELLDNDKLSPLIEKFIKSKMIETNTEIVRDGVPDIVTRANVNTLTNNEMLDFVKDNKAIQQYISKLFWKSYLESIDIDAIKKIIKDKYYDPQYEQEYDDEGIEIIIYRAISKTIYGDDDTFPYVDIHLTSDEFANVLERELPKEIFEARVTPVGMTKYSNAKLYITDDNDEVTIVDNDGNEYNSDLDDDGTFTFLLIFEDDDNTLVFMDEEDIFEEIAPEVFKQIKDAGGKADAGSDYVSVITDLKTLKKLYPIGIAEARVTPMGIGKIEDYRISWYDSSYQSAQEKIRTSLANAEKITIDKLKKQYQYRESDDYWATIELNLGDDIIPRYKDIKRMTLDPEPDGLYIRILVFDEDKRTFTLNKKIKVQDIAEARVTPVGMGKIEIPSGWSKRDVDNEPDEDGNIEVEIYSAPMEGWDENHEEIVTIMKNPQGKYFLSVYIPFGDWGGDEETYTSLYDAQKRAVEIMEDLKEDWYDGEYDGDDEDDYDDIAEARVTPVGMKKIQLPDPKWEEFPVDKEPDLEEDFEVELYGAPMEGWDTDHYDFVKIMSTPKYDAWADTPTPLETKYFIQTYLSFSGTEDEEKRYDSLNDARKRAVEVMKDIMKDWEYDGDE